MDNQRQRTGVTPAEVIPGAEPANLQRPSGMRILRFLFILGMFPLEYCVVAPHPVLGCGLTAIGVLVLAFCAAVLIFDADTDDPVTVKDIFLCLLPWLLAASFVANWTLDKSQETLHQTNVVDTHFGKSWNRVIVRSWRPGRTTDEICFKDTIYLPRSPRFFYLGESVTVGVKPGALGMPWVSSVSSSPYPNR